MIAGGSGITPMFQVGGLNTFQGLLAAAVAGRRCRWRLLAGSIQSVDACQCLATAVLPAASVAGG